MIPVGQAMRSLLALKLFGNARHSHVMSDVLDEGLALFAGLNRIPKRAFLTEYSEHGKAMYLGKALTEVRSPQRKLAPDMLGWSNASQPHGGE